MAGYSRIRIFNTMGSPLVEIDAATVRSWVLDDVGRCQFTYPIYDPTTGGISPKCTAGNFQYGNFILVEHAPSKNNDGTYNGALPPWVGMILAPQSWEYGKITVTAMSAENILLYRPMPFVNVSGTPGTIFSAVLGFANALGGFPIQPGNIDPSGASTWRKLSVSGLEEVKTLSIKQALGDWDVTPKISSAGQLQLFGNWYQVKGQSLGLLLNNNNIEASTPLYTEQGQFFNTVYGYSDSQTDGSRQSAVSVDQAGLARNGLLATNKVFSGTTGAAQPVIQALTDAYLAANVDPLKSFAPVVQDVGLAFSALAVGNTLPIQTDVVGFSNSGIGFNGSIRIAAMEYDELSNQVKFAGVTK